MQIAMTLDHVCALARAEERQNVLAPRIFLAGTVILVGCFLYNAFFLAEPWIRLGSAWTLGWLCYVAGTLQREPRRMETNETCTAFLEREYAGKRQSFLAARRGLFLLIPGIVASCWGGGRPWPLVAVMAVLTVVWFAFGRAAEKARRDSEEIRRSVSS